MDRRIRPARPEDAALIAAMANALNRHEGKAPDAFTAEHVRRDGFGADPAFEVLLAELGGKVVGYALFVPDYETDIAARALCLCDLFVAEGARSRGVGRALMSAVAAEATRRGARSVSWGVRSSNGRARAFYRRIGGAEVEARIVQLQGAALAALAAEGRPAGDA